MSDSQVRAQVVKILWNTYILVEGVRCVMGEEQRRDRSHVGLDGIRHGSQTAQESLVRLNGTNEVVEKRGVKMSSEISEETSGFSDG